MITRIHAEREVQPPKRQNPYDGFWAALESGYAGIHVTAIGLPYVATQYGGDRAIESARRTSELMSNRGVPDAMPVILKEVELVKNITRADSSTAIAGVFLVAALLGADAIRRFRRLTAHRR